MDSDLFVDIMKTLKSEFVTHGHTITDYLLGISELPRLQMLVMFCSDDEILCKYLPFKVLILHYFFVALLNV